MESSGHGVNSVRIPILLRYLSRVLFHSSSFLARAFWYPYHRELSNGTTETSTPSDRFLLLYTRLMFVPGNWVSWRPFHLCTPPKIPKSSSPVLNCRLICDELRPRRLLFLHPRLASHHYPRRTLCGRRLNAVHARHRLSRRMVHRSKRPRFRHHVGWYWYFRRLHPFSNELGPRKVFL